MPTVKLAIPYKSQWDPDAKDHNSDCGPTCLSMILGGLGDNISPDLLYRYIGAREVSQYTSFGDLAKAAKARGLDMLRRNFLPASALDELKKTINAGQPFIALVKYAFWEATTKNKFKGSHFAVVTGYDDTHIYVHDPLFRGDRRDVGRYFAHLYTTFTDAWAGFAPGENPNYATLIASRSVPFEVTAEPVQPTRPVVIDDSLRRRIRAKAAYDGLPDPNFGDQTLVAALLAGLNNWGTTWDTYNVRRGDNLSKIALIFYGDRNKWKPIIYFNDIANPNIIFPGTTLLIPKPDFDVNNDAHVPLPGFGGPT